MIQTDLEIPAPAAVAWRLLTDTEAWPRWGPSVLAVEAPARFIGPGTRGQVQTALGLWLPFEITDWQPDCRWGWRVAGLPATGHVPHEERPAEFLRALERFLADSVQG